MFGFFTTDFLASGLNAMRVRQNFRFFWRFARIIQSLKPKTHQAETG
jgi:hypothetical protein